MALRELVLGVTMIAHIIQNAGYIVKDIFCYLLLMVHFGKGRTI